MCIYSKFWLQWEKKNLSPYAIFSDNPWYTHRALNDSADTALDSHGSRSRYRTAYEIDKDRITNSQAFRRLEYKTQVFVTHEGDNYRTRLTHSLEVAEISRHIARALRLNEHLVESIALGHDMGHAPYGHAAEKAINLWIKSLKHFMKRNYYFCHNRHSVENVEHLEPGYDWDNRAPGDPNYGFGQGLNLTRAVKEGILVHTTMGYRGQIHEKVRYNEDYENSIRELSKSNKKKGFFYPGTLEAQVVRIADDLAQRIHDMEDGFRSNMLNKKHIREILNIFFKKLNKDMFDEADILEGRDLKTKNKKTRIPKAFLDDIVQMIDFKKIEKDTKGQRNYSEIKDTDIKEINNKLEENRDGYKDKFLHAAQVSFLLHMWRNDKHITELNKEEQESMRTRILKYLKLLRDILGNKEAPEKFPPTYHIIAFLRGIMLANVIEHSYWNIHRLLDPDFSKSDEKSILKKIEKFKNSKKKKEEKWYILFIIVDGCYKNDDGKLDFSDIEDTDRRFCFSFESGEMMKGFIEKHFEEILSTNGSYLESEKIDGYSERFKLNRVYWLNKSEHPVATEYVEFERQEGNKKFWIPLEKVRIFFTGYKDICPGTSINNACDYSREGQCINQECKFYSEKTSYPDVNRLIEFQEKAAELDKALSKLIKERIHRGSRISRMNYMGEKIILELLDLYKKYPRTMHDRVWSRLRIYAKMNNISEPVKEWAKRPIYQKEKQIIPKEVIDCFLDKDENDPHFESNQYSLIRTIINHIAGMTDRFISNEYNRVNQSGREVELQDEIYFFS